MRRWSLYLLGWIVCIGGLGACSTGSSSTSSKEGVETEAAQKVYLERTTLRPSRVHRDFAFLEEVSDNPLSHKETRVRYAETGREAYDEFFLERAVFEGTLVLAEHFLEQLNTVLEKDFIAELVTGETLALLTPDGTSLSLEKRRHIAARIVSGKTAEISRAFPSISPERLETVQTKLFEQYPTLERVSKMYAPVQRELRPKRLETRTQHLDTSGHELLERVETDFSDNEARAAAIREALQSSIERLDPMSRRAMTITRKLEESTTELTNAIQKAEMTDETAARP